MVTDMLTGYQIWDNKTDKPGGYATVEHTPEGAIMDIEVVSCTIPNAYPELWVATAHQLCSQHYLAGVIFNHEGTTVSISEVTPF